MSVLRDLISEIITESRPKSGHYAHLSKRLAKTLVDLTHKYDPEDHDEADLDKRARYVISSFQDKLLVSRENLSKFDPQVVKMFLLLLPNIAKNYGWRLFFAPGEEEKEEITLAQDTSPKIEDVPKLLYHATPKENADKVLKQGLVPMAPRKISGAKQRNNFPRIYLARSLRDVKEMIENFKYMDFSEQGQEYAIFKVDTSKCRPGTKFFVDREDHGSVWTATPIPAEAITVI